MADKFGHVRVNHITYSVPIRHAYRPVWVKLYHDRVAIAVGAEVVAQHARAFYRGSKVLDARHVLELLERKHRAVPEATALLGWQLAPVWQQVRAELARPGGDPLSDKRRAEAVPTFAEAATAVVEQKQAGWRSPRQAKEWLRSLERFAFPRIGSRPVSEVTSADALEILSPIWHTKAPTAKSVRQRIRAVLEWAVAMEYRTDNPCDRIGPVLGPQRDVVRHMPALAHRDVAGALKAVRASKATMALKLAFEFLVLTAARSGEVRLATWDEIDTAGRVWTIAATRMKANRAHRVPLSERALEILAAARTLADGNPLVFPNRWGNCIKDSFLSQMLKDLEIPAVPHGHRSCHVHWRPEQCGYSHKVLNTSALLS